MASTTFSTFVVSLTFSIIQASPANFPDRMLCEGKNYCTEKPVNYPEKLVMDLFTKSKLRIVDVDPSIQDRNSQMNEQICPINACNDLVYQIIDEDNRVRIVAQVDGTIEQRLEVVECINPGAVDSNRINDVIPSDVLEKNEMYCEETRLHHRYLVLSKDFDSLEMVSAKGGMPVWCNCRYKSLQNYS